MGTLAVKGLETGAVIGWGWDGVAWLGLDEGYYGGIEDHDLSVTGTVFRR